MAASCSRPLQSLLFLVPALLVLVSLVPTVLASSAAAPPPGPPRFINYSSLPIGKGPSGPRRSPSAPLPPIADLNTTWVNSDSPDGAIKYEDGSVVRLLLARAFSRSIGLYLACGFFCRGDPCAALFSVFLVSTDGNSSIPVNSGLPQLVWSANRNRPVGDGALLELTSGGRFILSDSEGREVWSANTSEKSVAGVNLTEKGNLVLYNSAGGTVWQSFDHATDTVLPGQPVAGQRLVANSSLANSSEGMFFLNITSNSFYAYVGYVGSGTPEMYYSHDDREKEAPPILDGVLLRPQESRAVNPIEKFMRLEWNGHLRLYEWSQTESAWKADEDLLTEWSRYNGCSYPNVCGDYGICSTDQQCTCPTAGVGNEDYFALNETRKANHGCRPLIPLSCEHQKTHILLPLRDISYFGYLRAADMSATDVESCKRKCLRDCSCKVAFFKYNVDRSKGDCYLQSRVFSLIDTQNTDHNWSAFVKVQLTSPKAARKRSTILGSTLGGLFALLLLLLLVAGAIVLRRRREGEDELQGSLQNLPGMPTRFSYEELRRATENFSSKLGEGGFGSVFRGTLSGGTRVAVKLLGGKGQGTKEFLAEVETIGSIHHVNLVRLVGYCAHKLRRLLVYEYMCNGSLDWWIFPPGGEGANPATLDWRTRHKIVLHVAKGLAYLHEECRHRIAHLDIKPENILLDESFNAKVSDFGLSKQIDRDQSQVVTTMRGTPGYLAPEWLSCVITEKVDVFSFGVVVLETVCGRRNVVIGSSSRPKQSIPLVDEVKSAAREERLLDVLDRYCEHMADYQREEAMEMVKIALWCLQGDPDRRPPMSLVVKVLEGAVGIESFLNSADFSAPTHVTVHVEANFSTSSPMVASVLSGAR